MHINKKAFTLVELIVVITILAILGTIAFISLQGYSASSRDSVRISDIKNIENALELFSLDVGKYPEPTVGLPISYSGGEVWIQGTIGDNVISNLQRLNKKPTDPLTDSEYTYSVLNTNIEFEIGSVLEGDLISLINTPNIIEANAASNTFTSYVHGTYNGIIAKVDTGSTTYVLAVPTIISTEAGNLLDIIIKKQLAFNGYNNTPSSYKGKNGYTASGTFDFNSTNVGGVLVYEGPISDLKIDSNLKILADNLKLAYNGTDISNNGIYKQLIAMNTSKIDGFKNIVGNIANNTLKAEVDLSLINKITNLSARAKNAQVQLEWKDIPGSTYNIYRKTGINDPYTKIIDGHITTYCTYLDSDVVNGTFYYYVVTSVIDNIESPYSNEVIGKPILR